MFLAPLDILGNRYRLQYNGNHATLIFVSTLFVTLLEDVPQLVINSIYIDTMKDYGGADAVSIVSLALSVISLLVNLCYLVRDCGTRSGDIVDGFGTFV